jgi:hypothetical protein
MEGIMMFQLPRFMQRRATRRFSSTGRFRPTVEGCESRLLLAGNVFTQGATYSLSGTAVYVPINVHFVAENANGLAYVGPTYVTLTKVNSSPPSTIGPVAAFCVDVLRDIGPTPSGLPYTAQNLASSVPQNASAIAYLYNHDGAKMTQSGTSAAQGAGLQLAIWALEYNSGKVISVTDSSADFYVDSTPDSAAAIADAKIYLKEVNCACTCGETAIYLNGQPDTTSPNNFPTGAQGLVVGGTLTCSTKNYGGGSSNSWYSSVGWCSPSDCGSSSNNGCGLGNNNNNHYNDSSGCGSYNAFGSFGSFGSYGGGCGW